MLSKLTKIFKIIKANYSWETRRNYLVTQGAEIGEGTRLNCKVSAFGTEPYLISIGENCLFAGDIHLITHDGGVKVLNSLDYFDGKRMDKLGKIVIGNNVYLGYGAMVMPGVTIGDNCVIGAKAVVTRDIPSNSVAVGMPAKVIKTIDEYFETSKGDFHPTAGMSSEDKKEYVENNIK